MMKKWICMLAAMLMAVLPAAYAEEALMLTGVIGEMTEEGILLNSMEFGEVLVQVTEETVFEGVEPEMLAEGQGVVVTTDGRMTRSLPPMTTAVKIGMYAVYGTVEEVADGEITVAMPETGDSVIVTMPENAPQLFPGCPVTAYTDGAMTMSIPARVNAFAVHTEFIEGTVTGTDGETFVLAAGETEYVVNLSDETLTETEIAEGAYVRVYTTGAMTFSLPPQVSAVAVTAAQETAEEETAAEETAAEETAVQETAAEETAAEETSEELPEAEEAADGE